MTVDRRNVIAHAALAAVVQTVALVLTSCGDEGSPPTPSPPSTMSLSITQTAKLDGVNPDLLKSKSSLTMQKSEPPSGQSIRIDKTKRFQKMLGFGGAFTEASALNWRKLSKDDQDEVIKLYFGDPQEGGLGYTVGRVPMGSCDFSVASYNFNNASDDVNMIKFDTGVTHDEESGMLPMIRAAQELVQKRNVTLDIFASPWSPPQWMKLPVDGKQSMTGSAKPLGLDSKYQQSWANYFSAFISAYKERGVKLWGVTPQNEPEFAAAWEACVYTPEFEASFVRDYLGPVLHADHPGMKIIGYDHNKDHVVQWAKGLYSDPEAKKFFDGLGVHWYGGLNTQNLNDTHNIAPDKFILATEACNCPDVVFQKKDASEWWSRAEKLGIDILEDIKFWSVGWVDWNLVLDVTGGPNHLGNRCDANIIADPEKTIGTTTFIKQASYYYMGHFSQFIPKGSYQVGIANHVKRPPLTAADVLDKKLKFEACSSSDGMMWSYDESSHALMQLGLCAEIDGADQGGFNAIAMKKCTGDAKQQWLIEDEPSGSGKRLKNGNPSVYLSAKKTSGPVVGMDPGTDVEAGVAEALGSDLHAFDFLAFGGQKFPKGFHIKASDGTCLLPVGSDTITFDAAAFETPSGDINVIAMNLGEQDITFDLYDDATQSSAKSVKVPTHSITSFSYSPSKSEMFESLSV